MAPDALRYFAALTRSGLLPFARQALGDATLADVVERWARKRPRSLALQVGAEALGYAELALQARAAAQRLHDAGARSGDVVALVGRNSIGYVALLLGAARLGVTLALVHPELSAAPLGEALQAAGPSAVVCEEELAPEVAAVSQLPLLTFEPQSRAPFPAAPSWPPFAADRRARDFALVYTSGTTGEPKACRLPHSRVLAAACLFGAPLYDFRAADRLLCPLPLYHGSPLMLGLAACLVTGTPLLLERRFSASELLTTAARAGATVLLYVGDVGRMLLSAPAGPADRAHRLRLAVGNGMAPEVWQRFQERFAIPLVREFYAATESPVGIFNLSGRPGSVGNLPYAWMFGLKLVRFDEESGELLRSADGRLRECSIDEAGELLVRARRSGLGVYHGYVDQQATRARLVSESAGGEPRLFRTGDVLRRDRDGFYYFVERRGDSYRFRGENVAVAQVERELEGIAGVRAALVTGIALPGYDGRVGLAAIVTDAGFDPCALDALSRRLPRSALPRFVRRVAELPRTSTLKLRRTALALEGADPSRVGDELHVLSPEGYRRLDAELYRAVLAGELRL